jgi:hypothetical protein
MSRLTDSRSEQQIWERAHVPWQTLLTDSSSHNVRQRS